jgi:RND family efflux transporter MFP subunit
MIPKKLAMKQALIYMLFAVFILNACKQAETDTEHAHDEESIQITAYGDDFEVFAEAETFVNGKSSEILAHFTWLNNFKPLTDGQITTELIVGTKGVRQTAKTPLRPGIYQFSLQPIVSGKGKIIFKVETKNKKYRLPPVEIFVHPDEHSSAHTDEEHTAEKADEVVFTKEQSWKIDFKTELPKKETFGEIIKTTAHVQAPPQKEIRVTAKTDGIVLFNNASVLEGTEIRRGQSLFTVSGREMADNNFLVRYTEAENNYRKAKTDYEKALSLAEEKIVSEKELREAKNTLENAKAIFQNLQRNFTASGQNVKSPSTGFIRQLFKENGSYVKAGETVLTVSQNETLILRADLAQKHFPVLKNIQTANFRTLHDDKVYSLEEMNGKILSYGKAANEDNHLLPVYFQIENNAELIAGSFTEIFIKIQSEKEALSIPKEALLEEQGKFFVYVQVSPEIFEKREVVPGKTDGRRSEILKGLSEKDRIVTQGAIFVKLAQQTGTLDAHSGHVH